MSKLSVENMTCEQAIDIAKEVIKNKSIIDTLDTETITKVLDLLIKENQMFTREVNKYKREYLRVLKIIFGYIIPSQKLLRGYKDEFEQLKIWYEKFLEHDLKCRQHDGESGKNKDVPAGGIVNSPSIPTLQAVASIVQEGMPTIKPLTASELTQQMNREIKEYWI